jgi:hypothetical protein
VSDQPDPEKLLAEALRAQAVRAPRAEPPPDSDPVLKLLSGTDAQHGLLSGRASDTVGVPPVPHYTAQLPRSPAPLSAWWIVLLAVLLGLAAGAVVGLVSVL